jgi:D-xylose transport system substrate-binding protein
VSTLRRSVAAAAAVALALGAAACESTSSSEGDGGGGKKIALLLPESQTTRYEAFDRPLFEKKVKDLCSDCEIIYSNASQDEAKQQQQVDAAIANGANVIVLDPVNGETAGTLVAKAKAKDIPVVSYDRLILKADVDYYISFDNEKVGELQAQALVDKLKKDGKTSGKIVMINGGPTDNNAKLFNKGAHKVLDGSGFEIVPKPDFFTPEWKPENAQTFMNGQIATLGKTGFIGVYAANDGTGGGAIAAMRTAGIKPIPPVTGQDAELAAIQRILTGEQYMTVYKPYAPEAEGAAELAVKLAKGEDVTGADAKVNNVEKDVASVLLEPIAVTKENVKDTIIKDQLYKVADICTAEYAEACKAAGIS